MVCFNLKCGCSVSRAEAGRCSLGFTGPTVNVDVHIKLAHQMRAAYTEPSVLLSSEVKLSSREAQVKSWRW